MTKLYITRHGETEWNIERRMQGRLDSPLTLKGKEQAAALGKRLASVRLDAVYSSTAPRAVATAEIAIAGRLIQQHQHAGLCEYAIGEWEGKTMEELKSSEPANFDSFINHPDKFIPPAGAETFSQLQRRLAVTLGELAAKYEGKTLLLVAHGVVMRCLRAYLLNVPIEKVWHEAYKPTALSILEAENGNYSVKLWNDTSHYQQ